jgi:hypothetical protein
MRLAGYQYEAPSSRSNYTTMEATVQPQSSSTPVELDQRSSLRTIYELLLDNFVIEIDNRFGAICSQALLLLYQLHIQHRRRLWWSALQPNEMKRGRGEEGWKEEEEM